jgi:hypothetical protein
MQFDRRQAAALGEFILHQGGGGNAVREHRGGTGLNDGGRAQFERGEDWGQIVNAHVP